MKKPDITPAQIVGLLVAGIPILSTLGLAFGIYSISPEQQDALAQAVQWGGTAAGLLFLGDAGIRIGRSRMLAPQVQNITAVSPGVVQTDAPAPTPGVVHSAGDTGIDDPADEPDAPPPGR